MIDEFFHLPPDNPFNPTARFLIVVSFLAMLFTIMNGIMLVLIFWLLTKVYRVKAETRDLLAAIREWVGLGRVVRDQTFAQGDRIEETAKKVHEEVKEIPEKVAKKITEANQDQPSIPESLP
jgi:hypothetical protein